LLSGHSSISFREAGAAGCRPFHYLAANGETATAENFLDDIARALGRKVDDVADDSAKRAG
jgi:hypothetical protein